MKEVSTSTNGIGDVFTTDSLLEAARKLKEINPHPVTCHAMVTTDYSAINFLDREKPCVMIICKVTGFETRDEALKYLRENFPEAKK